PRRWTAPSRHRAGDAAAALVSPRRRPHRNCGRDPPPRRAPAHGGAHDVSFHPNDLARRSRVAATLLLVVFVWLGSAFFRAQVLRNEDYALQSRQNRLREVPLPAPRGVVLDRHGHIIAESVP